MTFRRPRGFNVAAAFALVGVVLMLSSAFPGPWSGALVPPSPPSYERVHLPIPHAAPPTSPPLTPSAPRPAPGGVNLPATWSQLCSGAAPYTCANAPPSFKNAKMVWDNADHYDLLFGGQTTVGSGVIVNTSYSWKAGAWTKLGNGPTTLTVATNSSMVYDSTDGYVVLFGGWAGTTVYRSYTFKFLAGTWTLLTPGTAPTSRAGAAFFDVPASGGHGGYSVLFGGQKNAQWLSDTWEFAAGVWTNVTATAGTPPAGRAYAAATYDPADHYGMLFGGAGGALGATLFNDTWEWNPVTSAWVSLIASGSSAAGSGPVKQLYPAMNYVDVVKATVVLEVVLTCGAVGTFVAPANQNGGCATYTWSGASSTWTNISSTAGFGTAGTFNPRPGYGEAFAHYGADTSVGYDVRAGGETSASVVSNSTYAFGNLPAPNPTESTGEFLLGGQTVLYANASGGTLPYTYAWSALPTGCSTANASSLLCVPSTPGSYAAWSVTLTTPDGLKFTATGLGIVVDSLATVTATVANATPDYKLTTPSTFWGNKVYLQTSAANASLVGWWKNASLFSVLRQSPPCDTANYSANVSWTGSGASVPLGYNWTQLKLFLAATGAKLMLCLNGQVNNPGWAVNEMRYVETNLSIHPYYWSVGNEPDNYLHWNKVPSTWAKTDNSAPTALQWAKEIQNYTAAMLAFDPTARIIGIQGGKPLSGGEAAWMYNLSKIDGPNLTAVAEHNYPDGLGTQVVPESIFLGRTNLTVEYSGFVGLQQNISLGCPTCHLPLFLTEFNSYVTGLSPTTWEAAYAQVPYDGIGLMNVLKTQIQQFTYYDFWDAQNFSLVNSTTSGGAPRPAFYLYANVLAHMPIGNESYANLTPSASIWNAQSIKSCGNATDVSNACSYLFVNANTTVALNVTNFPCSPTGYETIYVDDRLAGTSATVYASHDPTYRVVAPLQVVLVVFHAAPVTPPLVLGTQSLIAPFVGLVLIVPLAYLVLMGLKGDRRE